MGLEQGYNVTEVGSWPYETYDIKPVTPNQFSLGADHDYGYTSKYFYSNTGNVEIDNIHNSTSPVYVTYTNIDKTTDADDMINISWKDSSSKITFQMDENENINTNNEQVNNPLHGLTLAVILERLVEKYGWEKLGLEIKINCFIIQIIL